MLLMGVQEARRAARGRAAERNDEDALDNSTPPPPVRHATPAVAATPPPPRAQPSRWPAVEAPASAGTNLLAAASNQPQEVGSNELGKFFLHNLGFFVPFMVPGLLPVMKDIAGFLPPPFDYLLNVASCRGGAVGLNRGPIKKMFHTCPPRAPPPFNSEPPPAPPLFPVRTRMPDWGLLTPSASMTAHSWFVGPHKNNPDEPDGWRRGELTGRFTPRSSGLGKVVDPFPTQGIQYPFSSGAVPVSEPLAHTLSPAADTFSHPGIWLQLGSSLQLGALPATNDAWRAREAAARRAQPAGSRRRRGLNSRHEPELERATAPPLRPLARASTSAHPPPRLRRAYSTAPPRFVLPPG